MSDELKELLGSGDEAARGVEHAESVVTVEESPTVLDTDRWTKRAGERLAAQWSDMLASIGEEPNAMCDPNVAADAVETLLSPEPAMAERPADQHRAAWWAQLLKAPETTALRSRTVTNPAVAEIAAGELAGAYATYVVEHPPKPEGEEGEGDGTDGTEGESAEESIARMRSTRAAMQAAAEAADAAEAVGAGLGLGGNGTGDASALAQYTRRLRQSPNLAAIMRMAGRFIAKANRLQRQRTDLVGMEITGVELSGDLARALPLEVAQVAGVVPELETLALLKLVERRVLSYKRIRREPMAMGPIVVSVDESGSMAGERIAAAKGLALAMASIARAQKRPFMLVAWASMGTDHAQIRYVHGDAGTEALVEWLEHFDNGGTDLRGPLWSIAEAWPTATWGQHADHIIITDGDVGLPDWLRDHYRTWSHEGRIRTFALGVGVRSLNGLAQVCDGGVWTMPSLDLDNPAIDVVLSIGPTA